MRYHCSRCHHILTVAAGKDDGGEPHGPGHCPQCKAEAGLEPEAKVPLAMVLFSMILLGALVVTATFGVLTLTSRAS